jgi:hypothetical protein
MSNEVKAQPQYIGDFAAVKLSMRFSINRIYLVPVATCTCPKCYLISMKDSKTDVLVR